MTGSFKVQSRVIRTKRNTKSRIYKTHQTKMKDNTNTLMGCVSTEPRQMDNTENNRNSKSNINNTTKTNERTI